MRPTKFTGKGPSFTRAELGYKCEAALAAEVRLETRTIDLPSRNILRKLLDLAT